MVPTGTLEYVEGRESLVLRKYRREHPRHPKRARLVGLVFCRPEAPLAKQWIFPSLPYYHRRSGKNTAFYFGGYSPGAPSVFNQTEVPVDGPVGKKWLYSARAFDEFRRAVQKKTKWEYSGGCDLILANVKFDGVHAVLDFSSSVVLRLEHLQELPAAPDVSTLFEKIFQYAEQQHEDDPAWGFSDRMGIKLAKGALFTFLLSFLPSESRKEAKAAFRFIAQDISKPSPSRS